MDKHKRKKLKKLGRKKRIKAKVRGAATRPRLSVFRSNTGMYLQLVDDHKGITLASAHSREVKLKNIMSSEKQTKNILIGFELGKLIAQRAKGKKITEIVFDRGGYKYHGRVKAVAEGAREGGLKF